MDIIRETAEMSSTERMAVRNANFEGLNTEIKNQAKKIQIIESGTDGIWNYRKWSDGTAECWGFAIVNVLCSNQSGNIYCSDNISVALPSGLFAEDRTITNANCSDVWSWIGWTNSNATSVGLKFFRGSNYSQTYSAGVYLSVKGRWK